MMFDKTLTPGASNHKPSCGHGHCLTHTNPLAGEQQTSTDR